MKHLVAKYANQTLMAVGAFFAFAFTGAAYQPKPPAEFLKK